MQTARPLFACSATLLLVVTTGCFARLAPKRPAVLRSSSLIFTAPASPGASASDQIAATISKYHAAIDAGQAAQAKIYRDQVIFGVMANIEYEYGEFEGGFLTKRAAAQTAEDAAQLGATAAAAVVGAVDIKDLLAASAVALHGARLSIDKNFFQEKTTEALLAQMRAARSDVQAQIIRRSASGVADYSLEEAWKDLERYFNAGTLQSALIQISVKAGQDAAEAQNKVSQAIVDITPPTAKELADARDVNSILRQLRDAARSPESSEAAETRKQDAKKVMMQVLQTINVPFSADAGAADIYSLFQAQFSQATSNRDRMNKLKAALFAASAGFGDK